MTYHARTTDPLTSHEAQDRIRGVSDLQADILRLFRQWGPMTDEQLIDRHNAAGMVSRADSRIRTARGELVHENRLLNVGESRTRKGYRAILWDLPHGTLF